MTRRRLFGFMAYINWRNWALGVGVRTGQPWEPRCVLSVGLSVGPADGWMYIYAWGAGRAARP